MLVSKAGLKNACDLNKGNPGYDNDFIVEDLDFDGFNDFRFVITPVLDYRRLYSYWRYDTVKKLFVKFSLLDNMQLTYPGFDSSTRRVFESGDDHHLDRSRRHGSDVFIYKNGKLKLVETADFYSVKDQNSFYFLTVRRKRVNGKWKIVEKSKQLPGR